MYYLARRFSGSLVPAMILHGLWDFSTFSSNVPYAGIASPFIGVAAVVVVLVLLRRDKRRGLGHAAPLREAVLTEVPHRA
ncbi:hypothetical protein [Cryobacterium roopkundense]|uniref:hypothetical protein n=1 Tax=Cryobacterium roopkundense TaxID=1001240 RepID=UPI001C84F271|nr:hypothetical protein [Cryobacterium roopkundense]